MPKLKTNSSAKKRFKITGTGKVSYKNVGKRHGMTKRSNSQIRDLRKTSILSGDSAVRVLKNLMPYSN